MGKGGIKTAAQNRKAYHDYFVEDKHEAGIELRGTEVKSIRLGALNLKDSYAAVTKEGELYVYNMHISPYEKGNIFNHDPDRPKRLLMHKRVIANLLCCLFLRDAYFSSLLCLPSSGSKTIVPQRFSGLVISNISIFQHT